MNQLAANPDLAFDRIELDWAEAQTLGREMLVGAVKCRTRLAAFALTSK